MFISIDSGVKPYPSPSLIQVHQSALYRIHFGRHFGRRLKDLRATVLLRILDTNTSQSYFMWMVSQAGICRVECGRLFSWAWHSNITVAILCFAYSYLAMVFDVSNNCIEFGIICIVIRGACWCTYWSTSCFHFQPIVMFGLDSRTTRGQVTYVHS